LSAKKALLAALFLVLVLLSIALVVPLDAPGLGREVESRVRSATGIELEIARSRLRVRQGLVLEDVSLVAGRYRAQAPRIALELRPFGLLRGRWELKGIRLEEARVDFEGGPVSIETLGLRLSRLDYDSRAVTPLHGLLLAGDVVAGRIALESREVWDLGAKITAENGRVELQKLRLLTDRGGISGEVALDFNSFPFRYRASLLGTSFALEGIGRGTLRLEVEGFGTKTRDVKGKGTFELERGRLPDAAWVREIDPTLAGEEHAPVEIPFEARGGRVYFETFPIEAAETIVELEGSVGLDGSRDIRAKLDRRRD